MKEKKVAISLHAIEQFDPNIIRGMVGLDYIHIDVMDGMFVTTKRNNLSVFNKLKNMYRIPINAHLMVKNPIEYIDKILDYIDIFTFHYESEGDKEYIISMIKKQDKKVGIAINPKTKFEKIIPFLNKIDLVLIMSVEPGLSGQKFLLESIEKINLIRAYKIEFQLDFLLEVDGGVNLENARMINSDILCSASTILKAKDPNEVIKLLKQ